MTEREGGSTNATAAVMQLISADVAMREALLDAVNSAMPADTVDEQAAQAGAVAKGIVMGNVVDGTVVVTPESTVLVTAIGDRADVEWAEVGEALLLEVVSVGTRARVMRARARGVRRARASV